MSSVWREDLDRGGMRLPGARAIHQSPRDCPARPPGMWSHQRPQWSSPSPRSSHPNVGHVPARDVWLRQPPHVPHMLRAGVPTLVLLRGPPGSGKSTLAAKLARMASDTSLVEIVGADDFFIGSDGVYRFDSMQLSEAHASCRRRVETALRQAAVSRRTPLLIVDNTNTCQWEMRPYAVLAARFNVFLEIVTPATAWCCNVRQLARCNSHDVPAVKIAEMLDRLQASGNVTPEALFRWVGVAGRVWHSRTPAIRPSIAPAPRCSAAAQTNVAHRGACRRGGGGVSTSDARQTSGITDIDGVRDAVATLSRIAATDAPSIGECQYDVHGGWRSVGTSPCCSVSQPGDKELTARARIISLGGDSSACLTASRDSSRVVLIDRSTMTSLDHLGHQSLAAEVCGDNYDAALRHLSSLLPHVQLDNLQHMLDTCGGDVDWAASILLDDPSTVSHSNTRHSLTDSLAHDIDTDSLAQHSVSQDTIAQDSVTKSVTQDLVTDSVTQDLLTDSGAQYLVTREKETDSEAQDLVTDSVTQDLVTDSVTQDLVTDSVTPVSVNDAAVTQPSTSCLVTQESVTVTDSVTDVHTSSSGVGPVTDHITDVTHCLTTHGLTDTGSESCAAPCTIAVSNQIISSLTSTNRQHTATDTSSSSLVTSSHHEEEDDEMMLTLSPRLLLQLQRRFCSPTDHHYRYDTVTSLGADERSVYLSVELARDIYEAWQRGTVPRHVPRDDVSRQHNRSRQCSPLLEDEWLAQHLQMTEDAAAAAAFNNFNNIINNNNNISSNNQADVCPSLQIIMDEQLAFQLSNEESVVSQSHTWRERLLLSRLCGQYPGIDDALLTRLFNMHRGRHNQLLRLLAATCGPPASVSSTLTEERVMSEGRGQGSEVEVNDPLSVDDLQVRVDLCQRRADNARRMIAQAMGVGMSAVVQYYVEERDRQMALLRQYQLAVALARQQRSQWGGGSDGTRGEAVGTCDLHGVGVVTGVAVLSAFIEQQLGLLLQSGARRRCLHVITGHGVHSAGGQPVMRNTMVEWLRARHISCEILDSNAGCLSVVLYRSTSIATRTDT